MIFSTSSLAVAERNRDWGLWSVHDTLFLLLLPPQKEDSSHSFPAPVRGFLLQETVLHEIFQCESFPRAAVLQKLLQRGSLPQRAVLQEQNVSVWVSYSITSSIPAWASLFMGPLVLPQTCSSVDLL